jgi:hypothetical protein
MENPEMGKSNAFDFDPAKFDPSTVKYDEVHGASGMHAEDCPCTFCAALARAFGNAAKRPAVEAEKGKEQNDAGAD